MKVRYLGTFHGASYGSYDIVDMDAYSSIEAARSSLFHRLVDEMDYVTTYRQNADGEYIRWENERFTRFPGTTKQDSIELHKVINDDNGVLTIADGPYYRLTMGPREGVKVERY